MQLLEPLFQSERSDFLLPEKVRDVNATSVKVYLPDRCIKTAPKPSISTDNKAFFLLLYNVTTKGLPIVVFRFSKVLI